MNKELKIEQILENLVQEIGHQVTRDYESKNGIWEGMSYSNFISKKKALNLCKTHLKED